MAAKPEFKEADDTFKKLTDPNQCTIHPIDTAFWKKPTEAIYHNDKEKEKLADMVALNPTYGFVTMPYPKPAQLDRPPGQHKNWPEWSDEEIHDEILPWHDPNGDKPWTFEEAEKDDVEPCYHTFYDFTRLAKWNRKVIQWSDHLTKEETHQVAKSISKAIDQDEPILPGSYRVCNNLDKMTQFFNSRFYMDYKIQHLLDALRKMEKHDLVEIIRNDVREYLKELHK